MSVTLAKLCNLTNDKYNLELLAGSRGINNIVTWIHQIEDIEVADFLHGNELVFITGIAGNFKKWVKLCVENLYKSHVSGIVFNIGPYIEKVPQEIIDYCNSVNLPLFSLPWVSRIVDVSYDFCHIIMQNEEEKHTIEHSIKNAIYFPENTDYYRQSLELYGFSMHNSYCAAALEFENSNLKQTETVYNNIRFRFDFITNEYEGKAVSIIAENKIFFIFCNFKKDEISQVMEDILTHAKTEMHIAGLLHIGISNIRNSMKQISTVCRTAEDSCKVAKIRHQDILDYSELGFDKLILSVSDRNILKEIYSKTLMNIKKYDEMNETDYLQTLRVYLENECSVNKTAEKLYVHRNTINYKIKKSKELTGMDFNENDKLKLTLAFHIMDILEGEW